ncbi:MFS transporter [Microbacterium sp. ASV49]|uniref:MFS transporter n=1 Tax=Microbacterium candidum TaxID=3041922 RepID=A0ABT7MXY2_9MICO|nr:MFS transporter [Microbacterium sp. ASV49]MDL9979291.1 MFS transporter [Microbacterium sp. ASV49]
MTAKRRWVGLAMFSVAALVIGLDLTILAVALPTLSRELHASQSELQWFSTAFMLTLAAAMLPTGVLGDRIGRRKTLVGALVVFAGGSLWCALSTTPGELIAARALMGVPAAAIAVVTFAMIAVMFTPEERPKAIGIMMGATFLGMPLGPVLGGWILTNAWWGWVFLINVPVAVIALVGILLTVPETKPTHAGRVDVVGMVGFTAGLVALTYGLITAGQNGWDDAAALGWMAAGILILVAFAFCELWIARTGRNPVIPPRLFRVRGFTAGTIVPAIGSMALTGLLFLLPQYFQAIGGQDAMGSGVRLLAVIAGFVPASLLSSVATRLMGARFASGLGYVIAAAGLWTISQATASTPESLVLIGSGVLGFGIALGLSAAASAALSHIAPDDANTASSVYQALQKTGSPLGVAILGSIFNRVYVQNLVLPAQLPHSVRTVVEDGVFGGLAVGAKVPGVTDAVRQAFMDGLEATMWACVGIALATAVIAMLTLPGRSSRGSGRGAESIRPAEEAAAAKATPVIETTPLVES